MVVLNERQHLEFVQMNDIYLKVGTGYRLITDKRDGAGDLIDLGYNLYSYLDGHYIKFMDGPKGDIVMPAGEIPLPPPRPSTSKRLGREADEALETVLDATGCVMKGCMWYLLIGFIVSLIGGIIVLLWGPS